MSKFGRETKDKISPLSSIISKAAPPVALKVLKICLILYLLNVEYLCLVLIVEVFNKFLFFNSLSKYFSIPEIP